jgi:predicted amidophosphoribosyltransferase
MALSESPQRQALRELGESVCAACQSAKKPKQSFCPRCYYTLPEEMRTALYRRFGSGYESAYDDAKDWLRQEKLS